MLHHTPRVGWVLAALLWVHASDGTAAEPDFARDVRPILARHCLKCHGVDDQARKAKLRLDTADGAFAKRGDLAPAIVAGKPDDSELYRRIMATDENEVMPPPSTKNPLTAEQKDILRRWIAAGAKYQPHWAFTPPRQAPLPPVRQGNWPLNAIDYFVLARLEAAGLGPSPPADRYTLVRRVYLDLIGLPPTPAEADAFVRDPRPDAYERLVDRLLASPHYGERWARRWLDLARYADTNGYEKDRPRSIWPYRDWVIHALNADLPFDRFTIDQLAGDLAPNATPAQRVATGFHRNTMLNEEGGIDPLEFRFHAMTDRVGTTATTWLGLTLGCAQCHTHKFDPIHIKEYYQFMAFMNNADEPEMPVPQPLLEARRADLERQIAALEADLPTRFPPEGELRWHAASAVKVTTASGASAEKLPDGAIRLSGTNPAKDSYTIVIDTDLTDVTALRLEALTDPALPNTGPGRTPHGNFVLTELTATAAPQNAPERSQPVKFATATADVSQDGFPAINVIDGQQHTGWAIHATEPLNHNRTAIFTLEKAVGLAAGTRWTIKLDQQFGGHHTLGKFRISLGQNVTKDRPVEASRREHLERKFAAWRQEASARAARWTVLRPTELKTNLPLLTLLEDGSVLASGDMTKRDLYELTFGSTPLPKFTAVRLEVLPDDSLPRRGPGRVYYEGPHGDFFLSEITLLADGKPLKFNSAWQDFASGNNTAKAAIDSNPLTGWTINGGQGKPHVAVFSLPEPVSGLQSLKVNLLAERYYAAGIGRFRISIADLPRPPTAGQDRNFQQVPADVEELLAIPADRLTPEQNSRLLRYYVSIAPELAGERSRIQKLRDEMPSYPTTLVLQERPANNPRPTFIHRRGEFLSPTERVEPELLKLLPPLDTGKPRNRLTFAEALVDPRNPLVGRVTMNRSWAAFFGQGIVRTQEDFGYQGAPPSHPELLDWLAVEFVNQDWSMKRMHRLMVTSATYRQSSRATAELLARDPENRLVSRGPRVRLEAELIRDAVLKSSGLLTARLGGPSVFPPQPASVTSEGAYGALAWKVSEGPDRYRRGLYTFSKRTAPYAMFTTFDAPSGEACVARREVSNTPLQALTLLNDPTFTEACQALGRQLASQQGTLESRVEDLFRRCLTRPPSASERDAVCRFHEAQRQRFLRKELDSAAVAGPGEGDAAARAAWTITARALLNLDEVVTKD